MATKKTASSATKKTATKQASKAEPKVSVKAAAKKTASVGESKTKKTTAKAEPSHEEITALAYQYWVEGGRHHGSHHHDWVRAEAALRNKG